MKGSIRFCLLLLFPQLLTQAALAQYQVNGSASQNTCNCYTLTTNTTNQSGSVWNVNTIDLSQPFDFIFDVYLGCSNGGADGIAFGLQPNGTSVGNSGSGMGMGGVMPSLGVYLDTYQNGGDNDPIDDHISLNSNGDVTHFGWANDLDGPFTLGDIEDCTWHSLRVTWDPGTNTYQAYFDGTLYINYNGNIITDIFGGNPNVYWGFTGATGALTNLQQFCTSLDVTVSVATLDGCVGIPIQFADSVASFGAVSSIDWDYGDGNVGTGTNPTHTYTQSGTYEVITVVMDNSGCSADDTINVTIYDPPFAGRDTTIEVCNASGVVEDLDLSLETGVVAGGVWQETSATPSGQFASGTAELDADGLTPGSYTFDYILTGSATCDNDTATITVDVIYNTLDPGDDSSLTICIQADALNLLNVLGGTPVAGGQWYDPSWNAITMPFDPGTDLSGDFYYVNGLPACVDTSTLQVLVTDSPLLAIQAEDTVCWGEPVTLTALGDTANSYAWNTGDDSMEIIALSPDPGEAYFEVVATDTLNCKSTKGHTVEVIDAPTVTLGDSMEILAGEVVDLFADITGQADEIWWEPGTWISDSLTGTTTAQPLESILYYLHVRSAFGCPAFDSIYIEVLPSTRIHAPMAFTPNADAKNDFFTIRASGFNEPELRIFNRWGEVVFFSNNLEAINTGWNGQFRGKNQPIGTYVWYFKGRAVVDGEQIEEYGSFTLIR